MKFSFNHNSQSFTIDLTPTGKIYRVTTGDKTVDVEIVRADAERGKLELLIDGEHITAYVSSNGAKRWVTIHGRTIALTKGSGARKSGGGGRSASGELTAPMPGQVRAVNVSEGDAVTKGQTLLVLEAMKMEIRIQAPMDGVVKSLKVKQGQTVEREQILAVVEN
ncbi:MAG: acetyl-CoA carboxylase biotin carboxyl carrier protein subunit [Anaerolineales bacterium]|nr:acetyl-CoA carboxylase biotin carboxyl carrier protein subunit [Anaerolineales bacterium]